ncbi:MAG: hypothetical protein O3A46_00490, partial [Candidatus Poribacteria bacterium]|nr:hypothetical protein [Candidatus Poribacteria bacterium]
MRRTHLHGLAITLGVAIIYGVGCAGQGSPLGRLAPIHPMESYQGDYANIIVDTETEPGTTLELTQKGVTVRCQFWRRSDLDRKYNRGADLSAFYSPQNWKQGEQVDVFWVEIVNDLDRSIRIDLFEFEIIDTLLVRGDDPNVYTFVPEEENIKRLLYKKGQTLDITNGFKTVKPDLIETQLRAIGNEIPAKTTVKGYVPFFSVKLNQIQ